MKRHRSLEASVEQVPLIWLAGTSVSSTGSVLVRLAQNGYTREAHEIIALSRTASLVGRDSIGGLTELWDVMGKVTGKHGITRLMAIAINRSSISIQRAQSLIRDHAVDPSLKDESDRTALHHALGFHQDTDSWPVNPINIELVRILINAYPEAARDVCFGTLALHWACLKDAPLEVVYMILEKNIEAVNFKDENDMLPLHYLCASKYAQLDVAEQLLLWFPDSVLVRDGSGRTPLLHALGAHQDMDWWPARNVTKDDVALISRLAQLSPASLNQLWEGRLPLHFACKNKAPVEILEILLRHYPEALHKRDSDGMLPIHASCKSGSPLSSIKMLLDQYPLSASVQDSYGMLPLHYACESESCDTIKLLVERYPAAQMVSCKAGRCPTSYLRPTSHARSFLLPVHCALESKTSPETICAIIHSNQDFVRQKDGKEMLPIHVACEMRAHPSIIRALLSSYPESIRIKHQKLLPIAIACQRRCGVDTIRVFVESDPIIVRETSEFKRLPLHFASIFNNESEEDLDVIRLLIDTYPEGKQQCDGFDRNPHSYLPHRSKASFLFASPSELKETEEKTFLESSKRSQRDVATLEASVTNMLKELEENKALTSSDPQELNE